MFDHSPRKANIALLVFAVLLVAGTLIVGRGASDGTHQVVAAIAVVASFATLFGQYHLEDRAQERAGCDPSLRPGRSRLGGLLGRWRGGRSPR
jgi:hypothetical protein